MLEPLKSALASMIAALKLLDDANAPADVGARLDLAINRLQDFMPESCDAVAGL